jgi:hypothetical protein
MKNTPLYREFFQPKGIFSQVQGIFFNLATLVGCAMLALLPAAQSLVMFSTEVSCLLWCFLEKKLIIFYNLFNFK